MGAIYSIPLCAREKEAPKDLVLDENVDNNNEPMPTLQHDSGIVVSVQPLASNQQPLGSSPGGNRNSIINDNYALDAPEATSTPRSARQLSPASSALSEDDAPLELERVIDEEVLESSGDLGQTSDSGLEQSSSDELELGPPSRQSRPKSSLEPATSGNIIGNHDTCDEDEDEDEIGEEVDEPLERCPEPTVPDERVDSSSSDSSNRNSTSPDEKRKERKVSTQEAITELLADIVGGDAPIREKAFDVGPGFAERIGNEAVTRS